MDKINNKLSKHIDLLISRYPMLYIVRNEIISAYMLIEKCYKNKGKLIIVGNGGSASDSHHIVGELMKSFKLSRPISENFSKKMKEIDYERGTILSKKLEMPLTAISLVSHEALTTAYINDVDSLNIYAQLLLGYGKSGDVFLCISTSGNSQNIINATVVARASNIKIIGLTGKDGGELATIADVVVKVPATETYMIQELHVPIYHCWCHMLEDNFFGDE